MEVAKVETSMLSGLYNISPEKDPMEFVDKRPGNIHESQTSALPHYSIPLYKSHTICFNVLYGLFPNHSKNGTHTHYSLPRDFYFAIK